MLSIPKNVFAVHAAAGKENVRYALAGVHLEWANGTAHATCTDCHQLLDVAFPTDDEGKGATLIATADWKAAARLSEKKEPAPTLETGAALNGTATFTVGTMKSVTCATVEGRFPPWREVVPAYEVVKGQQHKAVSIRLDVGLLASLLLTAAKVTGEQYIELIVPHAYGHALVVKAQNSEGVVATGVLMPVAK